MDRDELEEDRAAFIAGEIGGAVVELIIDGVVINRDAIVERLEEKRRRVGNVIHKGVLRDAAAMVRKGHKTRLGGRVLYCLVSSLYAVYTAPIMAGMAKIIASLASATVVFVFASVSFTEVLIFLKEIY